MTNLSEDKVIQKLINDIPSSPFGVIMVGHQYSGKSTFINKLMMDWTYAKTTANEPFPSLISVDDAIHDIIDLGEGHLNYKVHAPAFLDTASRVMKARLTAAIDQKCDVIMDMTNLRTNARSKRARRLQQSGYHVIAVQMPILSDKELMERVTDRPNQYVDPDVVTEMRDGFEPVSIDEPFDVVYKIGT